MINLLVSPAALASDDEVEVEGAAYRHLFRVRRLRCGDRVRLVDGEGRARFSVVAEVGRTRAALCLAEPAPSGEPDVHLTVAAGALRPERASWLVEKTTEVGVSSILWYHSERSRRTYGSGTLDRLERVARAAVQQCGRSRIPAIEGMVEWSGVLERVAGCDALLLDPPADASGGGGSVLARRASRLLLVVGPEGGFTTEERSELGRRGARAWSLGPRTLRVESAAVVGSALLLLSGSP
jgi:16S rRNA (uracil1498-N3)-methyltransferase